MICLSEALLLGEVMIESSDFRNARLPLSHGAGQIPVLGFGTLIPDAAETIRASKDALEAGFRHFDCAERYGNEREVGKALEAGLDAGEVDPRGAIYHYKAVEYQPST